MNENFNVKNEDVMALDRSQAETNLQLSRHITDRLMECADWLGRNPDIQPDPRAWDHLKTYM